MRTHLDLFSGIGGFALACRWAGVQTIGFAEIEPYACKVLAKNFHGVPNYGDIRGLPTIDNVWLVTGGFPCQPFSVAGKRGGKNDDRWLWPEMAGVIDRVRPTWVLGENVPGIIGMELDTVLSDLEYLHYTAWTFVVPACAVDAQHRRDRVWIVAHATGEQNTSREGRNANSERENSVGQWTELQYGPSDNGKDVADTHTSRWDGWAGEQWPGRGFESADGSQFAPHPNSAGLAQREGEPGNTRPQCTPAERGYHATGEPGIWQIEPDVGRVADGLSSGLDSGRLAAVWAPEPDIPRIANGVKNRVDRLRGLGNAIVPQVAYQLIRMMIEAEQ